MVSHEARRLLTLCAIRVEGKSADWSFIAREACRPGGLDALEAGKPHERSSEATASVALIRSGLSAFAQWVDRVDEELELAASVGASLVTVLDDDYPHNLRLIWNLPPFLFQLGTPILEADARAVAVVGTRKPTEEGVRKASRMATLLSEAGVTVVSGLARGIDASAHTATLDAGGRTVAVIGTGITRTYPAEHAALAERVVSAGGLIVSQFWPSAGPARWTFPRRNVVMSGIAQGTVVIEASSTSGAKMQARLALEHGKRVFLLRSLVSQQEWAQKYLRRGAVEVEYVDDVLRLLASPERIRDVSRQSQLALDLT